MVIWAIRTIIETSLKTRVNPIRSIVLRRERCQRYNKDIHELNLRSYTRNLILSTSVLMYVAVSNSEEKAMVVNSRTCQENLLHLLVKIFAFIINYTKLGVSRV